MNKLFGFLKKQVIGENYAKILIMPDGYKTKIIIGSLSLLVPSGENYVQSNGNGGRYAAVMNPQDGEVICVNYLVNKTLENEVGDQKILSEDAGDKLLNEELLADGTAILTFATSDSKGQYYWGIMRLPNVISNEADGVLSIQIGLEPLGTKELLLEILQSVKVTPNLDL